MAAKIILDGNVIVIDGHYEITLDRIPSHAALVEWIAHMCDKTWFTVEDVFAFIYIVSKAKGWEVYGNHN